MKEQRYDPVHTSGMTPQPDGQYVKHATFAHLQHILEEVKKAPYLPLSVAQLIERLEKEGEAR